MKINQLRHIIREEVRDVMKETLQEIMNEAVIAASSPEVNHNKPVPKTSYAEKLRHNKTIDPLQAMFEQTRNTMTNEDYKSMNTGELVQKPNFASSVANQMGIVGESGGHKGIDISNLDFIKKSKAIVDSANEKTKQRHGVI